MSGIVVIDKSKKEITIAEVRITRINDLKTVVSEKCRKYDVLANYMGNLHKYKKI